MFFYVLFWILEIYFIINSVVMTFTSNFTLGRVLLYAVTVMLLLLLVFIKPILQFTSSGFGMWLKILFFVGCGALFSIIAFMLVMGYTNPPTYNEKAVVVLGAGLRGEKPSDVLRRRLDAAVEYHKQNPNAYIVVTGGQGPEEDIPEAVAMRKYLLEKGVENGKILLEDKSTSTKENLRFAKNILENEGVSVKDGVTVITNNFHCYRAQSYAKMEGYDNITTVPATVQMGSVTSCFLREVAAIFWLWFIE